MLPGEPNFLALLVFIGQFRRPIRRRRRVSQQFVRGKAHHLAKGGIHVRDAALKVSRAKPGDQRILHGLAKSERIGKVFFSAETPARIAPEQEQHHNKGNRHRSHKGCQDIGEHLGRASPAVDTQHHRVSRQIEQLLRGENATGAPHGAVQRQPGAVGFGERDLLAAHQVRRHQLRQHLAQRVRGHHIPCELPTVDLRQAQFHDLHAKAVGLRQVVAAGIGRAAHTAGVRARQSDVALCIGAP